MPTKTEVLQGIMQAILDETQAATFEHDGSISEETQDRVDRLAALAEEPALSRLVGELNGTEMAHAPAGYTHDHPLMIQGHAYVGGEFIPGDVLTKATAEEKVAVGGQEPPAKEEKVSKPMSARAKQILQEVSAIKFSDVVVDAGDYDSFDSIEERMTEEEIAEMETALEDSKEAYVDQEMSDFEPEVDEDDIANDAGYSHEDIEDRVNELIDEHVDDEDEADALKQAVQNWPSRGVGDVAISSLKRELRLAAGQADESFELPEALTDALDAYETTAEEEIKTATEEEKESQEESHRESLGERYDNDNNDRADYLREFWEDHQDRYQGKGCGDKTWCKDADGDDNLTFTTSDGTEYLVRAITTQREYEGEPVADLQFADSEGSFKVTGAGSAFEVFSNVVPAMTAWIKERQPKVTTFSAAEPSRQKLYDRLVRTVTGVLPDYFGAAVQSPGGGRYYFVGKRSEKEKLMEFVKSIKQGELHEFSLSDGDELIITELKPEVNPDWWTSKGWEDLFPELSKKKPKDLSHPAPLPDTVPTFYERLRAEVRERRAVEKPE